MSLCLDWDFEILFYKCLLRTNHLHQYLLVLLPPKLVLLQVFPSPFFLVYVLYYLKVLCVSWFTVTFRCIIFILNLLALFMVLEYFLCLIFCSLGHKLLFLFSSRGNKSIPSNSEASNRKRWCLFSVVLNICVLISNKSS